MAVETGVGPYCNSPMIPIMDAGLASGYDEDRYLEKSKVKTKINKKEARKMIRRRQVEGKEKEIKPSSRNGRAVSVYSKDSKEGSKMNGSIKRFLSALMVMAIAAMLILPAVPVIASGREGGEKEASAPRIAVAESAQEENTAQHVQAKASTSTRPPVNNDPWEVTSLDISKDVDVVTAPGVEISLEKTASESHIEMMVGETKDITFTIKVDAQASNAYYIAGNIFVQNTGDWPADVIAVSDTVWYKAGGPAWLPATSSITTTVPLGNDAVPKGGPHVYSYSGTFTLPVALSSVTAMSNLIKITISNKPDPPKPGMQDWTFHYRKDFAKPVGGVSTQVSLEDIETVTPATGLSYEIKSATINGSDAGSLTGPWALDLKYAPFTMVIEKELTAEEAGSYVLNNKARIGDLEDEVDVEIVVKEPERNKGAIAGHKWIDVNGNGEIDGEDIAYEGLTVELWKDGSLAGSTLTDAGGHFAFLELEPGSYEVVEILPEGYYLVYPPVAYVDNPAISVEVAEGQTAEIAFLNAEKARITGEKVDFTTGEPVEGVRFVLETAGGEFSREAFSDEKGRFDFGWLMPGEYLLYEVVPAGWAAVGEAEREFSLANGEEKHFLFTNKRLSAIYGYKWLDVNGDGVRQESEEALAGVTIRLEGTETSEEAVTDGSGYFRFEWLLDGQYMVAEVVPDGYYATGAVEVGVILEAGEERRVDFLNAPFARVFGTKWLDTNESGQAEAGEKGLEGVTIRLHDAEGELIASRVTAADGSYSFEGLKAGAYTVAEVLPAGQKATSPLSASFSLAAGEEKRVDFHNNAIAAGEIVTPPVAPALPGGTQTLPQTGLELTQLLLIIAAMVLLGALLTFMGLARIRRSL